MKPPESLKVFCCSFIFDHFECRDKNDNEWFFNLSNSIFNGLNSKQKQDVARYFDFMISDLCSSAEIHGIWRRAGAELTLGKSRHVKEVLKKMRDGMAVSCSRSPPLIFRR